MTKPTQAQKHNQMIVDRIKGIPAQAGTSETDQSPGNPNSAAVSPTQAQIEAALTELKARQPYSIDMDGIRPAMPGKTACIILDVAERDEIVVALTAAAEVGESPTAQIFRQSIKDEVASVARAAEIATIERCAQVLEQGEFYDMTTAAAAIRALKDNP